MKGINYVLTWMYVHDSNNKVSYAGGSSDDPWIQNTYWRCLFCLFESSYRKNKESVRHILYANHLPPKFIDRISTSDLIDKYGIEIREIKDVINPPKEYYKNWNTQFIILGILKDIRTFLRDEDRIILLDSDCIFNKPLSPKFFRNLDENGSLTYNILYPQDYNINGLSLNELKGISQELNHDNYDEMHYQGGEFICMKGDVLSEFIERSLHAYEWSIQRFKDGRKKFNTESHLFSSVSHAMGFKNFTGNKFIKRIWTDVSSGTNIESKDSRLAIWHLPSEKKNGFLKAFRLLNEAEDYSLVAYEEKFSKIFRHEPNLRDKIKMLFKLPLKKLYRSLKPSRWHRSYSF